MVTIRDAFQSAESVYQDVVQKSAEDAEFRAALLEDPKNAIVGTFGIHIPDALEIVVHESKGTDLHLALLPQMNELNEDELSAVAGGLHSGYSQ